MNYNISNKIEGGRDRPQLVVILMSCHSSLQVAGSIAKKGGEEIITESKAFIRKHGKLACGKTCHTNAGRLASHYVIHAVGQLITDN